MCAVASCGDWSDRAWNAKVGYTWSTCTCIRFLRMWLRNELISPIYRNLGWCIKHVACTNLPQTPSLPPLYPEMYTYVCTCILNTVHVYYCISDPYSCMLYAYSILCLAFEAYVSPPQPAAWLSIGCVWWKAFIAVMCGRRGQQGKKIVRGSHFVSAVCDVFFVILSASVWDWHNSSVWCPHATCPHCGAQMYTGCGE